MNELQQKHGEKGLVVVGVSNESEGLIKKWVADNSVAYPIAMVQGNATDDAYGVKGFPHSALVGPDGKVMWLGHPASLPMGDLEAALEKATFVPTLPAKYSSINALIAKKDFGKAHAAIEKALEKGDDEDLARTRDAIEKLAAAKVADAGAKAEAGDYAAAAPLLDEVARHWKGMPQADEAAKKVKDWRADKAIKDQIKAGEDFRKAEALEKTGDPAALRKAFSMYSEIAKRQKGTPIGDRAQAAADRLKGS